MANGEFPDEVTELIMSRLPVKSLVKFRSVSKSWKKTISDPRFVRMHLHKSKLRPTNSNLFLQKLMRYNLCSPEFLELYKVSHPYLLVRAEHDENGIFRFRSEANLGNPIVRDGKLCDAFKCSCDGIMLLSDYNCSHILWNPSTGDKALLPPPQPMNPVMSGICYDPITLCDFKVVMVTINDMYLVYSFQKGAWSEKRPFPFPFSYLRGNYLFSDGKFVDGFIYWVAVAKVDRAPTALNDRDIIYFDPRTDDFKTFPKPQGVTKDDSFNLVCLRGRLCVFLEAGDHLRIWIKDNESSTCWKELMLVENVKRLKLDRLKPICLLGDDDDDYDHMKNHKLVIQVGSAQFVVYSPSDKKFSQNQESYPGPGSWHWNSFCPTLLFPSHK